MKHSDFLPPFPRRLVAFASRYHRCALGSLPRCKAQPPRAWDCLPDSQTGFVDGGDRTSQVPGGPHYVRAVLSDPGRTSALGHYRASVLSCALYTASTPAKAIFRGSITRPAHSLSTLRRVDCSTATQDSLPVGWPALSGWDSIPTGSQRKVSDPLFLLSQASPGARTIRSARSTAMYGVSRSRRRTSVVCRNGRDPITRNGRRLGRGKDRKSPSTTRTLSRNISRIRSRSRSAQTGSISMATTSTWRLARAIVIAPRPAPSSITSSPGRKFASATMRSAISG